MLVNETKSAGRYSVVWNAAGVASGVYFYKLEVRDGSRLSVISETKRLVLLR